MANIASLYSAGGTGLDLFSKLKPRSAPVVDVLALSKEVGTASKNVFAPSSFTTYSSHVGNYLAFAAATNAPHDDGCPPGVPVTFQILLNYFVWYVVLKPNPRHPNQPHAASTLHVIMAAIKSAALTDAWGRTDENADSYGGVPGFKVTPGDRHVLSGVIKALAKLHPTGDADRKLPMRMAYLERIKEWYALGPTYERRRDQVWQGVGHQGMLRVGELVALRMRDILIVRDSSGSVSAVQVRIVTSKTADPTNTATGGAQLVTLAQRNDRCDVVGPLLAWMRECGALAETGQRVADRGGDLLFPSSPESKVPLTKDYVSETLRAGLLGIGLDPIFVASFSGRSLRAGGATDMRDSGVDWHVIVMQGRWRSDAWKVYFRDSPDVVDHLRKLRPVALDAIRHLSPTNLAEADATARSQERLPQLPVVPVGLGVGRPLPSLEETAAPAAKRRALLAPQEGVATTALSLPVGSGVGILTGSAAVTLPRSLELLPQPVSPKVMPETDQRMLRLMLERAHEVVYDPRLSVDDWPLAEKVMKSLERTASEARREGLSLAKTQLRMLAVVDTQQVTPGGNIELTPLGTAFVSAIKGTALWKEEAPVAETVAIVETVVGAEGDPIVPLELKSVSTIGSAPSRKSGRSTARWSKHQG
jgi:hypothetical protein